MFWVAALVALVMALLPHPPQVVNASDKVQHMLAFGVMAGLAALAWPQRLLMIGFGLAAFGGAIELLQMIPGLHRDGQVADWIADLAAATAVLLLAAALKASFGRRTAPGR
jgi:VanZ family protein